jgi:alpha-galactosidase
LISNLPHDGCVEVACLINHNGIQPTKFGRLPSQMAAICDSNMRYFDLAADAAVHKSKQHAEWALMLDPLTSAVCCPAEVRELTKRLFDAEAQFLPGFN